MGLFDKKYCDVCGEKIGLLGNRKLEDGNLCKNCAKKLSRWFDERRHSTVEQIKKQLEYREANREKARTFQITRSFGDSGQKLFVDDNAGRFTVNWGTNFESDNPDILDFSQATACELQIDERSHEITKTVDGKTESYFPPRYEYSYDFKVTIHVNHPFFDEMYFDLNSGAVNTGEMRMTTANTAGWHVMTIGGGLLNHGPNKYRELVQTGNEIKEMIDGWKSSAAGNATVAGVGDFTESFRTGAPIPYMGYQNGVVTALTYLDIEGEAQLHVVNPAALQAFGGIEGMHTILNADILMALSQAVNACAVQGVPVMQLAGKAAEMTDTARKELEPKWGSQYGIAIQGINFRHFSVTSNSGAAAGAQQTTAASENWTCPFCGSSNTGRFCTNCGAKRP